MFNLVVPKGQSGESLCDCVTDMLPKLHQSDAQKLIKKSGVRLNGARIKKNVTVNEGDVVELYIAEDYAAYLPDPEIVYEDENLLVINKQPGMSCSSDKPDGKPTVCTIAEKHMRERGEYSLEAFNLPYVCHRLDHYTGGLVMIAKTQSMFESITLAIKQRRIDKFYCCIVKGTPKNNEAELHDFLIKDPVRSEVKIVHSPSRDALPIVTRYKTVGTYDEGELSLLDIQLVTGRTHQIRAHMASIGHPVLGDDKYGDRKENKKRAVRYQALWAYKLVFNTGKNNALEYMDGKTVVTDQMSFPHVGELTLFED